MNPEFKEAVTKGTVANRKVFVFKPDPDSLKFYLFGDDIVAVEGAEMIYTEGLQSSAYVNILVLGPQAVIKEFGYKRRSAGGLFVYRWENHKGREYPRCDGTGSRKRYQADPTTAPALISLRATLKSSRNRRRMIERRFSMQIRCQKHGPVEFQGTPDFSGGSHPVTIYCPLCESEAKPRVLILACSQAKTDTPGQIPAIDRYDGPAFQVYRKFKREHPDREKEIRSYILSAKFGLILAQTPIPDYDMKMTPTRAKEIQPQIAAHLRDIIFAEADDIMLCMSPIYRTGPHHAPAGRRSQDPLNARRDR